MADVQIVVVIVVDTVAANAAGVDTVVGICWSKLHIPVSKQRTKASAGEIRSLFTKSPSEIFGLSLGFKMFI